jgi:transmembrane sensor
VNPGTTVKFPLVFKGATREITVHGESYINVAPDEKRPFFVHMNKSTVQVLGTEFNVNSHDGQELISLVKGKVNVHTGRDSVLLTPGKEVLLRSDGGLTISEFNTEAILGRQKGLFAYAHKTPKELEKLIQRYYGVEVRLNNGDQQLDLSGVIDRTKLIQKYLNRLKMPYEFIGDSTAVIH